MIHVSGNVAVLPFGFTGAGVKKKSLTHLLLLSRAQSLFLTGHFRTVDTEYVPLLWSTSSQSSVTPSGRKLYTEFHQAAVTTTA